MSYVASDQRVTTRSSSMLAATPSIDPEVCDECVIVKYAIKIFARMHSFCKPTNATLKDPFETQNLPSTVRATLDSGAVIARFDRTGRFVAAGLRDGSVFLWDLATQAVVRNLEGHVRVITGLSYVFAFTWTMDTQAPQMVSELPLSSECFSGLECGCMGSSHQIRTSPAVLYH